MSTKSCQWDKVRIFVWIKFEIHPICIEVTGNTCGQITLVNLAQFWILSHLYRPLFLSIFDALFRVLTDWVYRGSTHYLVCCYNFSRWLFGTHKIGENVALLFLVECYGVFILHIKLVLVYFPTTYMTPKHALQDARQTPMFWVSF